ncbi:LysM peptidoglycan-binding domain-containing protein [Blastococcus sp. SYSU DS0541]
MDGGAALRVSGGSAVGGGEAGAGARPARHLRVLPPPTSYSAAVAPRVGEPGRRLTVVRTAPGSRSAAPPPPLRLTARGRRAVAVAVLLLGLALVPLAGAVLGEADGGLQLMGTTQVIVEPGDTLWSIAGAVAEGRDVRDVIVDIRRLNRLDTAQITPGQVLLLP